MRWLQYLKCPWKDLALIAVGTAIVAASLRFFTDPAGLVIGGVSGVATVVKYIAGEWFHISIPLWITNSILNIPLFIVTIKQKGFEFAKKSLYSAIWLSVCLSIFEHLPNWFSFENDLLLTTVCGAACLGVGTGLVFRAGATTGGTDTLASIIKFKYPHMAVSRILQIIDTVIIVSGLMVFGLEKTVYAMILVYISSKTINSVLEGMYFAQAAFILSDKYEAISQAIFEGMGRGNTGIHAQGMYTKKETKMLFVVVSQKQVPELRQLVYRIDPKAFMVVSDVREALGEGFVEDYESVLI